MSSEFGNIKNDIFDTSSIENFQIQTNNISTWCIKQIYIFYHFGTLFFGYL